MNLFPFLWKSLPYRVLKSVVISRGCVNRSIKGDVERKEINIIESFIHNNGGNFCCDFRCVFKEHDSFLVYKNLFYYLLY